jgi:tetratricopeptide (TPR) repeat protein
MVEFVLNWLKERWHSPSTAFFLAAVGVVGTLYLWPEIESRSFSAAQISVSIFVGLLFFGVSKYTNRVPKINPGNVGFTIAITAEDRNDRIIVSSDFVSAARAIFEEFGKTPPFQIIELPRQHAEKITDVKSAEEYRKKTGSHFLLFGTAKRRPVKGKDHYVLKLQGLVTHAPIPLEKSQLLAQEMEKILPLKVRIACEDSLDGFEVTSMWFGESAKFIIATAALLSGDFEVAKLLLENLEQSAKRLKNHKNIPGIKALLLLLPKRLANTYFSLSQQHHYLWRETRDPFHLDEMKKYIILFNKYEPGTSNYYASMAIWLFVRNRDSEAARKELFKSAVKNVGDPIWRLNVAFLYAYSGDMARALEQYEAAFNLGGPPEIPFELEEFIDWTLSNEPHKIQLHFCLGLINLRLKNDGETAIRDFKSFLLGIKDGEYLELRKMATSYIESLEESMRASSHGSGTLSLALA